MNNSEIHLYILFIDDDDEILKQFEEALPKKLYPNYRLKWRFCNFNEGLEEIKFSRYDIVVTDVWDEEIGGKGTDGKQKNRAADIVDLIRDKRFSPIIIFSGQPFSNSLQAQESQFIKYVDKVGDDFKNIEKALKELLNTEIPRIARSLHDQLDSKNAIYLWKFIEEKWDALKGEAKISKNEASFLEGLIRRRAAIQIDRFTPPPDDSTREELVEGHQYYIYPPISEELKLGQILKPKGKNIPFRIVLTPHCYLARRKVDRVLTIEAEPANKVIKSLDSKNAPSLKNLGKILQIPAELGKPRGRYCFLPRFLKIPNLYSDFLKVQSLTYDEIDRDYKHLAVLDTPFAEALQAAFTKFYSTVGIPDLNKENFQNLIPKK